MAHAGSATQRAAVRFELVDVSKLHIHEEIQPDLLERVLDEIKDDGYVKRPILVAAEHYVILDGHHRYAALKQLGCRRIPCYIIDYYSDAVELKLWPTAKVRSVTKDEVIRHGLADKPYTPKTTRHIVKVDLPEVFTDLEELF